jgi:hypothetical protein
MFCERATQIEFERHQPYRKHKYDSGKEDHFTDPSSGAWLAALPPPEADHDTGMQPFRETLTSGVAETGESVTLRRIASFTSRNITLDALGT